MSVLPYQTILKYCETKELITPWNDREVIRGKSYGLSHCGYDVRIKLPEPEDDDRVYINDEGLKAIKMRLNDTLLASTIERIKMPNDLVAIVHDKSSWARVFVAAQNTVAEPGWEGWLTIEITTHSEWVTFYEGDPIAQLMFHRLEEPTERPYTGKYQNQPDQAVPAMNEAS